MLPILSCTDSLSSRNLEGRGRLVWLVPYYWRESAGHWAVLWNVCKSLDAWISRRKVYAWLVVGTGRSNRSTRKLGSRISCLGWWPFGRLVHAASFLADASSSLSLICLDCGWRCTLSIEPLQGSLWLKVPSNIPKIPHNILYTF